MSVDSSSVLNLEEDEEDDETFEPDHDETSGTDVTTDAALDEEDEESHVEPELPLQEDMTQDSNQTFKEEDDGRSDFWPSDCEDDEEVVTHTKYNRESAAKYNLRGTTTFHYILKDAGSTHQPPFWVCTLKKFSFEEARWVDKGPVLLYFSRFGNRIQLVANYLYGIKSVAMNMERTFDLKKDALTFKFVKTRSTCSRSVLKALPFHRLDIILSQKEIL